MSIAERRHHRSRKMAKWLREHPRPPLEQQASNDAEWRRTQPQRYARTAKACGCYWCRNARRRYGNSHMALTRAELRGHAKMND